MSFSLLYTGHRKDLQLQPVRTSSTISHTFILPMHSSYGFGSIISNSRPIQTRFPFGFSFSCLNLARHNNSLAHSSIGTWSLLAELPIICKLKISVSISLPFPGFFSPFLHSTIRYRCVNVFSLRAWSPQIHAKVLGLDVTRVYISTLVNDFIYRTLTPYGWPSHAILLSLTSC